MSPKNNRVVFVGILLLCILGLTMTSPMVTKRIMPRPRAIIATTPSAIPVSSQGISLRYFNPKYPYIFDYNSINDVVACSTEEVYVVPENRNFDPCGEYKPEASFSVSTKPLYATYLKNIPEPYSSDYTITRTETLLDGEKAVKYEGVRKYEIPRAEKISLMVVTHKNITYLLSNITNPEFASFRFFDSKDITLNKTTKRFVSADRSVTFEYPATLYSVPDALSIGTGEEVYFFFKNGIKPNPSESDTKGNESFIVFVRKGRATSDIEPDFIKNKLKFYTDLYDTTAYGGTSTVTFRITPENKTYQNQLFSTLKVQ